MSVTIETPWGTAEGPVNVEFLSPDVFWVSTGSHGGIGVKGATRRRLSPQAKAEAISMNDALWFEEDCGWAICVHELPTLFPERHVEAAQPCLERWYPEYLAATSSSQNA